jgi:hypothetical protein
MDKQSDMTTEQWIESARQDMADLAELAGLVGKQPDGDAFFQDPVTAAQYAEKLEGLANRLSKYAQHIRRTASK